MKTNGWESDHIVFIQSYRLNYGIKQTERYDLPGIRGKLRNKYGSLVSG